MNNTRESNSDCDLLTEQLQRRLEWEQRHKEHLIGLHRHRAETDLNKLNHTQSARTDPVCGQLEDGGSCKDYQEMWYYNQFDRDCFKFIYSGCNGNANRFATKEACLGRCGQYRKQAFSLKQDQQETPTRECRTNTRLCLQ